MDVRRSESSGKRQCWVCYATEDDDPDASWVRPCGCRGSGMFVHNSCLQRWIDEKQRGNTFATVACPQCKVEYVIVYPPLGILMRLLQRCEQMVMTLSPLLTAGVVISSLYLSAFAYGALTVVEVMGYEEGSRTMLYMEPFILALGLPAIPVALISAKMIRWEDRVVYLLNKYVIPIQATNPMRLLPQQNPVSFQANVPVNQGVAGAAPDAGGGGAQVAAQVQQVIIVRDHVSASRIFIGALAMPSIAALIGRLMFSRVVQTPWKRSLLGGLVFVAVKGMFKVYFKYNQLVRHAQRRIMDRDEEEEEDDDDGDDLLDSNDAGTSALMIDDHYRE